MSERVDEKILDFINESEKREAKKDICKGPVKIGERYYEFEEKDFFDKKLKIWIPNDFEEMSEEARKFKYPSENRPEIIKCNEDGSIVITLNIIDSPLDEECVGELKDGMKMIIRKTNPSNVFYDDGIIEVNSKNIGFFEFKSSAIDDYIYNLMFFLEFEGKTLMGTFSCIHNECKEWRDVVFQIIRNIKENNKSKMS
ncbi:hypothetical protein [Clostridium saccharobutylicum]|uniref:Uncharacterized protein n=1 Tax=Clostridium saccharobutylicum DSM 13864 TaxID=1345695 RepID=U5MU80_CLOSA|nr:hypothetical protein [Clostridium saccharobutylicum]AGX44150.1 hypothetical protein CLSA_c31840 [Clostridium saccharobutylicum DSM 13864]AQR91438.1 hypothetical protein CLOSC_31630 [Clostridium saccharobutylicum]AQS01342.1 hypothetical protein CSACC_31700 [Clostridium saccharobutylicum]AQS10950.1 hypothetical protein CLOBY_30990 [Clostridium saccharobutylicum]AQS15325.1 hypothetical protein CLOSACC_31700 [Clostridium saccharobutylicum]